MQYAEISVNSPVAGRRTFSYAVPPGPTVREGQAVYAPFGEKTLQGVVMELTGRPAVEDVRDIDGVVEPALVLPPRHLALARFISAHYLSPLFETLGLMLPPGFERRAVTFLQAAGKAPGDEALSPDQQRVLELAAARVRLPVVEKELGKKKTASLVSQLVKTGYLVRSYELAPERIKPRTELRLIRTAAPAPEKLTPNQSRLLDFLDDRPDGAAWAAARRQTGVAKAVASALEKRGLVRFEEVETPREPVDYARIRTDRPLALTPAQQVACESIVAGLDRASGDTFLLRGVTGSGKTEVYLQALAEAVRRGRKGIVLVPEIALTPQTIERFAARFPHRVAVYHSGLTLGERYDEWRRIRDGAFDVVIGSRSAVFVPQPDLGLVVIDEEHEWTYKQDVSPHYHARDAAIKLAGLTGAVVVLGSATPDVESYYKAQTGDYQLLELPERIAAGGGALPEVDVVDMRAEQRTGNRGIFSRELSGAVNKAVAAGEQVILFLNRRGGETFIQCRACGFVLRCRSCEAPLSHHFAGNTLTCHQCGRRYELPDRCPNCGSPFLSYRGAGTQKVEQETRLAFPRARRLRWDSDAAAGHSAHEELLREFRDGRADILIGTQMIAKGLDIPSVTLVGVVNADTSLNLPDFRAGERTFQLLSQVAGRAGRGSAGGRVIIQTFTPDHYAVRAAARHDYLAFYEEELGYRRELRNPPFGKLARLVFGHVNDAACRRETERMKDLLEGEMARTGTAGIEVIGPAPVFLHRLRGKYRRHLILRGEGLPAFLADVRFPRGWSVDIDPVGMLR
jgi:primosomal protein N' (replication factor Y)